MAVLKKSYLVKKRNVLNEIRANGMTLQELRFLSIYLSKINPNDFSTRVVRFPINDFRAIMELGRINIDYLKNITDSLLSKIIHVPKERGGYRGVQLFKYCEVDVDDNDEWYIEFDAHDEALPLMFEFKDKYFSYQLWNALRLKSSNQLRMYEILKQYEKIGIRILSIEQLRDLLGIDKKEYKAYKDFRVRVLDSCQKALEKNTDITFMYEPYGKKGKGGKIQSLKFSIKKNTNYIDQLTLDKFIDQNRGFEDNSVQSEPEPYESRIQFLSDACDNEFTENEMTVLYNLMTECLPYEIIHDELKCYNYLMRKYNEMKMRNERTKIHNRFAYIKSIIGTE
ncbi:replication initiation protein [Clostridium minihomine]|uniref:replication initiation protein n=1 Tax=Clostridium minihomine TaxID=2045012 RepID=UPI000C769755|nr:replication initiation protein [Clostridium minihomine]